MKITALAGGIGGSKLLLGLYAGMDPRDLTVIVNTGDDIVLHRLAISPDLDIVTYTLAGLVEPKTGWGLRRDTFAALGQMARYGRETWFHLGDRDLATHIHRTALLRAGATLGEVTRALRQALGVAAEILPMSNDPAPTMIRTENGGMHVQEYLVKLGAAPEIRGIQFAGVESAKPAPGVVEAIAQADKIVICPSNPLISIGPILAVPGIRQALQARRREVTAVSPIVAGKSLKGPSDRMLQQLGMQVSAAAVAELYRDIAGTFVLDEADAGQKAMVERLGMRATVLPTVMRTRKDKEALARAILRICSEPQQLTVRRNSLPKRPRSNGVARAQA